MLIYDWYLVLSSFFFNHLHFELGVSRFRNRVNTTEKMAAEFINQAISEQKVVIFSKTYCPYCKMAKQVFDSIKEPYKSIELDKRNDGDAIQDALEDLTGSRTVPKVFVNKVCLGGGTDVKKLHEENQLLPMLQG